MAIDWQFINELEKEKVAKGYVPKNKKGQVIGKSGTTVCTGFDIGQHSVSDIMMMLRRIPNKNYFPLVDKLSHYTRLTGNAALYALSKRPLVLNKDELEYLDEAVKQHYHTKVQEDWDNNSFIKFSSLPDQVQTVLFSLGFNFGTRLSKVLPQTFSIFKKSAESKDYLPAVNWLDTFPSKNPELVKRRKKEALYLSSIIK